MSDAWGVRPAGLSVQRFVGWARVYIIPGFWCATLTLVILDTQNSEKDPRPMVVARPTLARLYLRRVLLAARLLL